MKKEHCCCAHEDTHKEESCCCHHKVKHEEDHCCCQHEEKREEHSCCCHHEEKVEESCCCHQEEKKRKKEDDCCCCSEENSRHKDECCCCCEEKQKPGKNNIFDTKFFITLSRVIASALIIVFTAIFVNHHENFVLALILYSVATLICLYDILWKLIKTIIHLKNPINMNLLISISAIGVLVLCSLIHYQVLPEGPFEIDLFEGALVVTLYQLGELFEHIASNKSKQAIHSALDLRVERAHLLKDDNVIDVAPEDLVVGQRIVVNVGDAIPVDGVIVSGEGSLDTSSLTGESLPVDVKENTSVLSGSIVKNGSLVIEVLKPYKESTVFRIMELIDSSSEKKSKAEKFISKFARVYTPIIFLSGIAYALIFGLVTKQWPLAIFGGLAILVVACPCAIVISVPLAYFAGVGLSSKRGIIIKGTNYLDSLCSLGTLFIDKTGTLTYGNFVVDEINATKNKEDLLEALYIAESRSNHPIAKAIISGVDISKFAGKIDKYEEFAGQGVKVTCGKDIYLAGTATFLRKNSVNLEDIDSPFTTVFVSKNNAYLGYVVLKDQVREDAKALIEKLNKLGIKVVLLSGDKETIVKSVSEELGIKEYYSSLLPSDKTKYVEEAISKRNKKLVAFAGDGINDTPSIVRADVGFAMGGIGSDVAVKNADIVLMEDNPKRIVDAVRIAKKVRHVALFNIIFSLALKATVIGLIIGGVMGQYGMLVAVLADTGLTVLMIINSLLVFYRKID